MTYKILDKHATNGIKSFREMSRYGASYFGQVVYTITPESIMSGEKWVVLKCKIQGCNYTSFQHG